MQKDMLKINFTSKIVPIKPVNSQFTLCKCFICALGKNGNKSNISEEAANDAQPTLYNIPVVGHLFIDKDKTTRMGGHDVALQKDEDGNYRFKALTVPFGVVPQQDNVHYEEVTEKDGTVRTYCVADVILWTGRYPELTEAIYNDKVYFAQSMEIYPLKTAKTKDGYTNIDKYEYSALCLLGKSDDADKNVEPCFPSSRVEPYEFESKEEWAKFYSEFKRELAKAYSKNNFGKEGGEMEMNPEDLKRILCEFGLAEYTVLSFDTNGMTEDELKAKLTEVYGTQTQDGEGNVQGEATDGAEGNQNEEPAQTEEPAQDPDEQGETGEQGGQCFTIEHTYKDKRDMIGKALCDLCVCTEDEYVDYCLIDFDSTYVYCCYFKATRGVNETIEKTVRMPYIINDGKIEINSTEPQDVRQVWLTKEDEAVIEENKLQLEQLKQYKQQRENDDRAKEYAAVLSNFSDLKDIEEYVEVVKNAMSFASVDALTKELYAIRGKNAKIPAKKSVGDTRVPVGFAKDNQQGELADFINKYSQKK